MWRRRVKPMITDPDITMKIRIFVSISAKSEG